MPEGKTFPFSFGLSSKLPGKIPWIQNKLKHKIEVENPFEESGEKVRFPSPSESPQYGNEISLNRFKYGKKKPLLGQINQLSQQDHGGSNNKFGQNQYNYNSQFGNNQFNQQDQLTQNNQLSQYSSNNQFNSNNQYNSNNQFNPNNHNNANNQFYANNQLKASSQQGHNIGFDNPNYGMSGKDSYYKNPGLVRVPSEKEFLYTKPTYLPPPESIHEEYENHGYGGDKGPSYDYYEPSGPPESPRKPEGHGFDVMEKAKEFAALYPWKKIFKFLTAVIPIGLFISALTPSIINVSPVDPR